MGVSVDAVLFFGFTIGQPGDRIEIANAEDWDGANSQWLELHGPKEPDTVGYKGPEWDQWREELRRYQGSARHVELYWVG